MSNIPNNLNSLKPSNGFRAGTRGDGFCQQSAGPTPLGGDIHDSFNVSPEGDIMNGHTTIQIPGGKKIRMPWE